MTFLPKTVRLHQQPLGLTQNPARRARGRERDLTGSLAIRPMPLPCSGTPVEPRKPRLCGLRDAAPGFHKPKASTGRKYRGSHRASASAVHASRATSPPPMQDSLPAGGLRLYREGVEPSGSLRKVSDQCFILLSRACPVASKIYPKEHAKRRRGSRRADVVRDGRRFGSSARRSFLRVKIRDSA